MPFEACE